MKSPQSIHHSLQTLLHKNNDKEIIDYITAFGNLTDEQDSEGMTQGMYLLGSECSDAVKIRYLKARGSASLHKMAMVASKDGTTEEMLVFDTCPDTVQVTYIELRKRKSLCSTATIKNKLGMTRLMSLFDEPCANDKAPIAYLHARGATSLRSTAGLKNKDETTESSCILSTAYHSEFIAYVKLLGPEQLRNNAANQNRDGMTQLMHVASKNDYNDEDSIKFTTSVIRYIEARGAESLRKTARLKEAESSQTESMYFFSFCKSESAQMTYINTLGAESLRVSGEIQNKHGHTDFIQICRPHYITEKVSTPKFQIAYIKARGSISLCKTATLSDAAGDTESAIVLDEFKDSEVYSTYIKTRGKESLCRTALMGNKADSDVGLESCSIFKNAGEKASLEYLKLRGEKSLLKTRDIVCINSENTEAETILEYRGPAVQLVYFTYCPIWNTEILDKLLDTMTAAEYLSTEPQRQLLALAAQSKEGLIRLLSPKYKKLHPHLLTLKVAEELDLEALNEVHKKTHEHHTRDIQLYLQHAMFKSAHRRLSGILITAKKTINPKEFAELFNTILLHAQILLKESHCLEKMYFEMAMLLKNTQAHPDLFESMVNALRKKDFLGCPQATSCATTIDKEILSNCTVLFSAKSNSPESLKFLVAIMQTLRHSPLPPITSATRPIEPARMFSKKRENPTQATLKRKSEGEKPDPKKPYTP